MPPAERWGIPNRPAHSAMATHGPLNAGRYTGPHACEAIEIANAQKADGNPVRGRCIVIDKTILSE